MTNLERAAAIAAERGWPLVETYRGWAIYRRASGRYAAISPHELSVEQTVQAGVQAGMKPFANPKFPELAGIGTDTLAGSHRRIDDFEAAREAMPATAFFGVEEEAFA